MRSHVKMLEFMRVNGWDRVSRAGRTVKPNSKYSSNIILKYVLAVVQNLNPNRARELFGAEETDKSIMKELDQMEFKEVWKYIEKGEMMKLINAGKIKILPSSLFLKDKYDASGKFEKLKSRLVCCGNHQDIGADDTESPTVGLATVMMLLSIAAKKKLVKKVFDVTGAYLNASLDEPEYMRLSKSVADVLLKKDKSYEKFVLPNGSMVVELKKAIYGLKQASRAWYNLLSSCLMDSGYIRSEIDSCLFYKNNGDKVTYVLVYVDDCLVMGTDEGCCHEVEQVLRDKFVDITGKEGEVLSFIGLEIKNVQDDIVISQGGYIKKVLQEYQVDGTTDYPSDSKFLDDDIDESECDKGIYLKLVMQLMYAAIRTRPDILYQCTVLATKGVNPNMGDYRKLIRIVKYLKGTADKGIVLRHEGDINVNCYVDASFNCHGDARGHSGFIIYPDLFGSCGILIKSIKQKTVADSSAEAELIALHECVKHLLYCISLYEELGYIQQGVPVYQDNQAVIKLSNEEPVNFKGRSKFINRKYFSVHEHVENGEIKLVYVGTDKNVSDFLTKSHQGNKFKRFRIDVMGSMEYVRRGENHISSDYVFN